MLLCGAGCGIHLPPNKQMWVIFRHLECNKLIINKELSESTCTVESPILDSLRTASDKPCTPD